MRALLLLGAGALALGCLGACDQDYAASNADRHSFMGQIHAAPLPSTEASAQPLPPPAMPPVTAAPAAPASASAAPAASASAAPSPSAKPAAPAASTRH